MAGSPKRRTDLTTPPGRKDRVNPGLTIVPSPVPTSRLDGKTPDEDNLLDAYVAHLRLLEDRTQPTVDTYLSHVRSFFRHMADTNPSVDVEDATPSDVRSWLMHKSTRGNAPITRVTALYALRSFYRFLVAEGLCAANPADAVKLPSPSTPRAEFYTGPEADDIIGWATAQPGRRWQVGRVILLTLRYSGLRLNELATLTTAEVDLDARRISLVGKGRKPRVVPIPHPLATALQEYLTDVRPTLPASPYLFANPNAKRKGRGRYSRGCVHGLVREAGASAGVSGRHFAHRWRHTYATSLMVRGEDIHVVQRLMGHATIATTTRYLHLSVADLTDAVDRAFPED
jgi:site-specific recombinase XerD